MALSPFGEKVVAKMKRVGIMVDISHANSGSAFRDSNGRFNWRGYRPWLLKGFGKEMFAVWITTPGFTTSSQFRMPLMVRI